MRLFCRKNHTQVPASEPNYARELLKERAHLAKLQQLPESDFAAKSHKELRFIGGQLVNFAVDNKADAIARCKAAIAKLEILAGDTQSEEGTESNDS